MRNVISYKVAGLIGQAQIAYPAAVTHGPGLGLLIKPDEASLRLTNLITSHAGHIDEKHELKLRSVTKAMTIEAAMAFGTLTRHALTPYFGKKPSTASATAGYVGSFKVPRNGAGLVALLTAIKKYLTENPEHENAALNVTAARAATLIADLIQSMLAVNEQKGKVRAAVIDRGDKAKLVRSDMQLLLKDLKAKADPLGEVWAQFGLKRPGAAEIPEMPTNLSVMLIGPTAASLKWNQAVRATGYRIWKKVVGVDEDYVLVDTRSDLDYTIEGLPSGATVLIAVAATNSGGDSARTEAVTLVMPV